MMHPAWWLIPHQTGEGFYNLTLDERILKHRFPLPVLRFYSWRSPCVSYGYFQNPPAFQKHLPAYRRITGGGIVFHNEDLTYSLTYPRRSALPWSVRRSYEAIHRVIQKALATLGVSVILCDQEMHGCFCFQSPVRGDLLYQGKKIAGAAQRRMGDHLLHQGSIRVEQLKVDRLKLGDAITEAFQETYQVAFHNLHFPSGASMSESLF
ncbi:MAG: lipoate--protein ligase family protein [Candidatus Omnitrophota bacterium]